MMHNNKMGFLPIFVVLLSVTKLSFGQQMVDCEKVTNCKCKLKDGKVIDLTPLDKKDGTPKFKNIPGGTDQFAWNPCTDFTLTEDITQACKNVAACQTHFDGLASYYSLGAQASAKFIKDATRGLELQYTDSSGYPSRNSFVGLECDPNIDGTLTSTGEDPSSTGNYYMTLKSKYCCPSGGPGGSGGGLSPGSVLVIIFISLLFVYMVAGVLFMKFGRQAEGKEMIPNHEFWGDLPGLIQEGFKFVFCRCRGGTYQEV